MKKLIILGGGESGVGAAILGKKQNYSVFLSDNSYLAANYKTELEKNNINYEEGKHTEDYILQADLVIKSPGIPDSTPLIQTLLSKSIEVISEIEFAARYTNATIIAITGSNGKTTTTSLIYHILKNEGLNVGLGGNIGSSFAWQVALYDFDYYVLEISSFQLDGSYHFHPHIAIMTNITPDHLDRYAYQFENYIQSKFRITKNQTQADYFVYFEDDVVITNYLEKNPIKAQKIPYTLEKTIENGGYLNKETNELYLKLTNEALFNMNIEELALQGKHNIANSMAAAVVAKLVKIRSQSLRKSLQNFEAVEHRLEKVLSIHGIQFINDSKATNVNAVYYALESIKTPIILIIGGIDKGNDYNEILDLVHEKVKAIICLGVDNKPITEFFTGVVKNIVETNSMEDAVRIAYSLGTNGDTVLLAPACASFDLFHNYKDRGNQFKQAVRKL